MRYAQLVCLSTTLWLLSLPALACGGGFGQDVTISPAQTIVVSYRDGQESYIFQPRFCGAASEFGLILPISSALTSDPVLFAEGLYDQLATLTAPRVETVEVCGSGFNLGSGSSSKASSEGGSHESTNGVDVIDTGTVGIFSWELLRADSAKSFTDWLDARKFPYPSSAQSAFDHYVRGGWYFIAFRVTASASAPQAGYRICGAFGPISVTFPSSEAIIPARMATAADTSSTFLWRLFTLSQHQMTVDSAATAMLATPTLRYAGNLTAKSLAEAPAVAAIASAGQWITEIDLSFAASGLTDDITLVSAPKDESFQRVIYQEKEVDCGVFGCTVSTGPHGSRWLLGLLAVAGGMIVCAMRNAGARPYPGTTQK
jgi:hypothetical protein